MHFGGVWGSGVADGGFSRGTCKNTGIHAGKILGKWVAGNSDDRPVAAVGVLHEMESLALRDLIAETENTP